MIHLYEEIVGRGGVSPAHFFYDMTFSEAAAFMRGFQEREKSEWERTRQIAYWIVQSSSTKELEPTDVMRFTWEEKKQIEVDDTEIERLRNIAKNMKL